MVENLLKQRKNLTQRDTERDWFIDEKGELALSVENQYLTLLRRGELVIMKSYATSIPWEGRDTSGECRLHSIACVCLDIQMAAGVLPVSLITRWRSQ